MLQQCLELLRPTVKEMHLQDHTLFDLGSIHAALTFLRIRKGEGQFIKKITNEQIQKYNPCLS